MEERMVVSAVSTRRWKLVLRLLRGSGCGGREVCSEFRRRFRVNGRAMELGKREGYGSYSTYMFIQIIEQ
jgi:hypothetical protein